jgi:hypothetical protein
MTRQLPKPPDSSPAHSAAGTPLPAALAVVVQLAADSDPAAGRLHGRVEHVLPGRRHTFASGAELTHPRPRRGRAGRRRRYPAMTAPGQRIPTPTRHQFRSKTGKAGRFSSAELDPLATGAGVPTGPGVVVSAASAVGVGVQVSAGGGSVTMKERRWAQLRGHARCRRPAGTRPAPAFPGQWTGTLLPTSPPSARDHDRRNN